MLVVITWASTMQFQKGFQNVPILPERHLAQAWAWEMGISEILLEEKVPNLNEQRCLGQKEQPVKVPEVRGSRQVKGIQIIYIIGNENRARVK